MSAIMRNVVVCFSIFFLPSYSDHRLSHPIIIRLEVSKFDVNISVFQICRDLGSYFTFVSKLIQPIKKH